MADFIGRDNAYGISLEPTSKLMQLDAQLADLVTVNNHTISYTYDSGGNVQTTTEKDASGNTVKTVTYTYDATSGNVTKSVTVMNGKTVTTTYTYDTQGNVTSVSNTIS